MCNSYFKFVKTGNYYIQLDPKGSVLLIVVSGVMSELRQYAIPGFFILFC